MKSGTLILEILGIVVTSSLVDAVDAVDHVLAHGGRAVVLGSGRIITPVPPVGFEPTLDRF